MQGELHSQDSHLGAGHYVLNVFDVDYLVLKNISPAVTYLQLWEILKGFTSQLRFKSTFMFCGFLNPYLNISIDMIFHQGPMANTVHNFWAMVQVTLSFRNIVF